MQSLSSSSIVIRPRRLHRLCRRLRLRCTIGSQMEALSSTSRWTTIALLAGTICLNAATKVTMADFGKIPSGDPVHIYTLKNQHGLEARITTYGGTVVSLKAPDRNGVMAD